MDTLDARLRDYFDASRVPAALGARLARPAPAPALDAERLADRFSIEAGDHGIRRLALARGHGGVTGDRERAEQARRELYEYFAGRRSFFSVPVDLSAVPAFQASVLEAAARIPFGEVVSYATLAERTGRPRAARAVGNALGANPVPVIVPCHRVIRGDGTWGHYVFGGELKTALLTLERTTPALVGSATTRIVCLHGCAHEQRITPRHQIVFASLADAQSVGYRPCRVCRPQARMEGSPPRDERRPARGARARS